METDNVVDQKQYITIDAAATMLGVPRSNLYYYLGQLGIKTAKFSLDRRAYIRTSDVERIRVARAGAATSTRIATDDVLVFLAELGLAVTPHSDPSSGYGYSWFGGAWEGPYPSPVDAIRAAFELADKKAQRLREMPFPTMRGELYWWDGEEWYGARHKEGQLEIRTFNSDENDGYEPVEKVIERSDSWLHPAPPTDDEAADEARERARLTALWLTAALRELQYKVDPIDWQHEGLQADVRIGGYVVGALGAIYTRFREDDQFLAWLRSRLATLSKPVGMP